MLGSVVVCINLCMALTGEALLMAVDQFKGLPRAEIVRRCGYVNVGESGQERLNNTAFFEALLQAKGFALGDGRGPGGRRRARRLGRSGRSLPFHTKVQFNGNLMVGSAYLNLLDAKPGDHFVIRLGHDSIRLLPLPSGTATAQS
jgi:hypothetical protein